MVAILPLVKKAASFGYKKYGVPGALASAGIVLVGYYYLKKALGGSDGETGEADNDGAN
ncbi:MAG: hypothetical protein QXG03_02650 [Halalkalicoccus sp.]